MISDKQIEEKVEELLEELTLEEKFKLMVGFFRFQTNTIPRLGIKTFKVTDGPLGISQHSSFLRKNTKFPGGINLAASWNRELAYECGEAIGREARATNRLCVLGPGINIGRTPLNGRTYEYYSEDPHLTKEIAIPFVKGIQSQRIAACPKHYVANNQETHRHTIDVQVDERTLQEIYLRAFKEIVEEADPWTIMTAYNLVNGEYVHGSYKLLKETLMNKWGFNGFVMTDWWATQDRGVTQPTTEMAINAGLTLEMPVPILYREEVLLENYSKGKYTEEDINELVRRLLRVYTQVGMFEKEKDLPKGERNTKRHQELARRMAEEGIVLLKNEKQLLPLNISEINSIAVLGPNAKRKFGKILLGGAAAVTPPYEITPLKGLKEKCKGKVKIIKDPSRADVVLLFMGLNHDSQITLLSDKTREDKPEFGKESEEVDRTVFGLPIAQIKLIKKTIEINPNTVVILNNANPISMEEWIENTPAILEVWYPGMEGGRAIANVLFGDVNPSGKLPMTFPNKIEDNSAHKSERTFPGVDLKVYHEEGLYVGYRHFDKENIKPLFPFGFGLSYTEFKFEEVKTTANKINTIHETFEVNVKITNVGNRAGSEVIQVYSEDVKSSVDRPKRELVGFEKVFLEPNETQIISIEIKGKDLDFYDVSNDDWNLEKGDFILHIGNSSRDIHLEEKITVMSFEHNYILVVILNAPNLRSV
ncbi:MAG: glycoside hydrolase family 3 C-terminal domain-containing protein [Candidatus Heimdallarchaeota archaeon]|nr:glycoside hydrolase family 3 C-terminal domain-containing protein [Candidatus Heimdallarchaeota archaeon]MCK4877101.1 glycoside hydrolase family 3 C-terminal domain-containing protein [Candidatus Heimdallarchaeota archaeon]